MRTRAELIGAGALARSLALTAGRLDHPEPFAPGEPMGQHLTVQKLVRVTEGRQHYLVDNTGRKWPRRKCWACGYKFSPEMSKSCAYCATPLEDLQFLMTQRWDTALFAGNEAFLKARIRHFGLTAPVFAFYRNDTMMSVYHYNGESYLVDAPAPLAGSYLLAIGIRVANTLAYLHMRGVVLAGLKANHIVVMPNGSVRLFDLDIAEVLPGRGAVFHHPDAPVERDMRDLGRILLDLCSPNDKELTVLLRDLTRGMYRSPANFSDAAEQLHALRQHSNPDPAWAGHASAITDVGIARRENEDSFGWRQLADDTMLYAVADGLGGHEAGGLASSLTVDVLGEYLSRRGSELGKTDKELMASMKAGMDVANRAVFDHRKEHRVEMGTTLTAVLLRKDKLIIGHCGDSRLYRVSKGKLTLLTKDHTVAQDLVEAGRLAPEDAATHRGANILTNTMGADDELEADISVIPVASGDRLLLCSDGLYNPVRDEGLLAGLTSWADRHKSVRRMLRLALNNGSTDNITAILIDVP
jgi:serine/threonine protein phosphatase PrpC